MEQTTTTARPQRKRVPRRTWYEQQNLIVLERDGIPYRVLGQVDHAWRRFQWWAVTRRLDKE